MMGVLTKLPMRIGSETVGGLLTRKEYQEVLVGSLGRGVSASE